MSYDIPLEKRPWLTTKHAAQYCDVDNVESFRKWARRRGVEKSDDGRRYRRTSLDRALSGTRPKPEAVAS